jgi:predicted regulator of Ras-like GTPase activity (Roadblock/LC7/MglB family)
MEGLRASVLDVVSRYPRKQLNRMLFEDEEGTLVVTCYPEDGSALLVAAKQGATLGAVSIAVDRLARKIGHVKET